MAMGDKGTMFVGTFDKGTVHAVVDQGGKKVVKPFITGLRMPTGVAFQDNALYVVDIDKLYKYDDPEANLDKAPAGKVVYDDFPPYVPHGWKYLVPDGKGWFFIPVGVPCNICLPPTSTAQYRRVNPANGAAEIVALGVRNSVGGAVDPRTGDLWFSENARDWMSDDMPSDKLNHVSRMGEHFGYPYCHQGDIADPKFGTGRKCSEFTPPVVKLGSHMAPLGMKFYTGSQFPAEYKNGIFIAEHGSWNRDKKIGYRIVFISVDPDGKNPKETVFAGRLPRRPEDPRPSRRHPAGARRLAAGRRRPGRRDLPDQLLEVAPVAHPARGNPAGGRLFLNECVDAMSAKSSPVQRPECNRPACRRVGGRAGAPRRRTKPPAIAQTCAACHGAKACRPSRARRRSRASPTSSPSISWSSSATAGARPGHAGDRQEPDRREHPRSRRLLRGVAAAAALPAAGKVDAAKVRRS